MQPSMRASTSSLTLCPVVQSLRPWHGHLYARSFEWLLSSRHGVLEVGLGPSLAGVGLRQTKRHDLRSASSYRR